MNSSINGNTGITQQFCVRWNSHLGSLGAAFPQLLAGQRFVDVTLACEGHQVHCHRLVLAACSTYFESLLGENPCKHPIIILPREIKLWAIQALVDFMYKGEVNVSQAGLPDLLKCAEILQIRGLCGSDAQLNLNHITSGNNIGQQQQQHLATTSTTTRAGIVTSLPSLSSTSSTESSSILTPSPVLFSSNSIYSHLNSSITLDNDAPMINATTTSNVQQQQPSSLMQENNSILQPPLLTTMPNIFNILTASSLRYTGSATNTITTFNNSNGDKNGCTSTTSSNNQHNSKPTPMSSLGSINNDGQLNKILRNELVNLPISKTNSLLTTTTTITTMPIVSEPKTISKIDETTTKSENTTIQKSLIAASAINTKLSTTTTASSTIPLMATSTVINKIQNTPINNIVDDCDDSANNSNSNNEMNIKNEDLGKRFISYKFNFFFLYDID